MYEGVHEISLLKLNKEKKLSELDHHLSLCENPCSS